MIKFLVKGQNIETLEHEVIAADQIAFVKMENIILPSKAHRTIHIRWSNLSNL